MATRLSVLALLLALAWPFPLAKADQAAPVEVRVGNHPGFGRVVLGFDGPVMYQQASTGSHLTLLIAADVALTPPAHLPQNVRAIDARAGFLDLTLVAGATTHVSWFGNMLVVDVFDPVPPGVTEPQPANTGTATPTTPTSVPAVVPASVAPALSTTAPLSHPPAPTPQPSVAPKASVPAVAPAATSLPPVHPPGPAHEPATTRVASVPQVAPAATTQPPPHTATPAPQPSAPRVAVAPSPVAAAASVPQPRPPTPIPQASASRAPTTPPALPAAAVPTVAPMSPPHPLAPPMQTPATRASAAPPAVTAAAPPHPTAPATPPLAPAPAQQTTPQTQAPQATAARAMPAGEGQAGKLADVPVQAAQKLPDHAPASAVPGQPPVVDVPATPPATASTEPSGPVALAAIKLDAPKPSGATLSVPFSTAVGVAAFRRGGAALVVFDERRPIDLADVRDDPVFGTAVIQLLPAATVLRLKLPTDRSLAIDRSADSWHIAVVDAAPPPQPIPTRATDTQFSLSADAVGDVVAVADPESGATLLVGTQRSAGQGIPTPRRMAEFNLLPTWLGVLIEPLADSLVMHSVNDGFLLTGGKPGLAVTPSSAVLLIQTDAAAITRRFHLRDASIETLVHYLRDQVVAAASVPPLARGRIRQAEAETMITLGMGEEAQAMLSLAASDDPVAGASADAVGLTAVAALLAGRVEDADGIGDSRLDGSDEVTLWRAVRAAETTPGSPVAAAGFATTTPLIAVYAAPLRQRLLPLAFETMIAGGQTAVAARLLAHHAQDPSLRLARAMLSEANGDTDGALALYDILAADKDRLVHATAAVRAVELRLMTGRIDTSHAADALDGLLYAWRGDRREVALRERVADLREQTGSWRAALTLLRETETLFPEDKDGIHARLQAAFARLLQNDGLDRLAPLELVALVEENADLLPNGSVGEALEERLADRLLALDLPQRAGPVLQKLMVTAPSPSGRAGFGSRLAALRLRENDAAGALAALAASAGASDLATPLPAGLIERRTLLAAEALARSGDPAQAVADLTVLGTAAADAARATILEQRKDWPGAEQALADYVAKTIPPSGALDQTQQRTLVRYATATAQAGDDATLATMRTTVGARMPEGPFGDMFRLLTAEPVRGLSDLPRATRETAMAHDLPKALGALKPSVATP